jgi:hypothetical protein
MSVAEKALALLNIIRPEDLATLPPAQRERFAQICLHVAGLAEPKPPMPKAGVLADLRNGHRSP